MRPRPWDTATREPLNINGMTDVALTVYKSRLTTCDVESDDYHAKNNARSHICLHRRRPELPGLAGTAKSLCLDAAQQQLPHGQQPIGNRIEARQRKCAQIWKAVQLHA